MQTSDSRGRHWRSIAGNIELFLGVYFFVAGVLAIFFFLDQARPHRALLSAAVSLVGAFLVLRARKLLGWRGWVFWFVALLLVVVPVALFLPAVLRFR